MQDKSIPAQNVQGRQAEAPAMKRYYVHDFLICDPILLDTREKTFTIYQSNAYGRLFNLESAERVTMSDQWINRLIRKLNNPNYSPMNSLVINKYIYTYFLTDDQRAQCRYVSHLSIMDVLIVETDDLFEAVQTMCEWAFENKNDRPPEEKENERKLMMKCCADYLGRLAA